MITCANEQHHEQFCARRGPVGGQLDLPPGFRFYPSDEELVVHYLCKKAASQPFNVPIIAEVDLYKYDPWNLPEKALFGEKEWYFFSPRDRKYPNGSRPNRAAGSGYWKATGTDKPITIQGGQVKVGVKKALVFYSGRAPKGQKTNWIMHEYRLADNTSQSTVRGTGSLRLDDCVLCRIYHKTPSALKLAALPSITSTNISRSECAAGHQTSTSGDEKEVKHEIEECGIGSKALKASINDDTANILTCHGVTEDVFASFPEIYDDDNILSSCPAVTTSVLDNSTKQEASLRDGLLLNRNPDVTELYCTSRDMRDYGVNNSLDIAALFNTSDIGYGGAYQGSGTRGIASHGPPLKRTNYDNGRHQICDISSFRNYRFPDQLLSSEFIAGQAHLSATGPSSFAAPVSTSPFSFDDGSRIGSHTVCELNNSRRL